MKTLLLFLAIFVGITCSAQELYTTEYIPTYAGGNYQYKPQQPKIVVVTAFEYTNYQWIRRKIKVKIDTTYGTGITVVAEYDKILGWLGTAKAVYETTRYDGEYIYQNFDYKIAYSNIYFNL